MAAAGFGRIRRLARRMLDGGPAAQSYRELLARVGPAGVHEGFYQEDLDVILRK